MSHHSNFESSNLVTSHRASQNDQSRPDKLKARAILQQSWQSQRAITKKPQRANLLHGRCSENASWREQRSRKLRNGQERQRDH